MILSHSGRTKDNFRGQWANESPFSRRAYKDWSRPGTASEDAGPLRPWLSLIGKGSHGTSPNVAEGRHFKHKPGASLDGLAVDLDCRLILTVSFAVALLSALLIVEIQPLLDSIV